MTLQDQGKSNTEVDVDDNSLADEAAGFAAAFGEVPDEQPSDTAKDEAVESTPEQTGDGDETDQQAVQEEAKDPDQPEGEPDERARLKELLDSVADLPQEHELTKQQIRQLHGKFGEINKLVHDLQAKQVAPVATKLDKEKFAKLNVDYPELAEALAEDLSNVTLFLGENNTKPEEVERLVEARVAAVKEQVNRDLEVRLLTYLHRDWREVTQSPEFLAWKDALPEAEREALNTSENADFIADKLTAFKTSKAKSEEEKKKRNEKLANAILPKSQAKPQAGLLTEQDGFEAAFKT